MNTMIRFVNTILLAGVLAVLILIFLRMPITLADLNNAKPGERKALMLRQAFVRLTEPISVSVENTPLSVEIEGTPSVEIDNTPLPVEIQR